MRRLALTIAGCLALAGSFGGAARAQGTSPYVGFGLSASTVHLARGIFSPESEPYWLSGVFAQVGTPVFGVLELRLSVDQGFDGPVITTVAGDVLYRFSVTDSLSLYAGAGPDLVWRWVFRSDDVVNGEEFYSGAHGTLGVHYQLSRFGSFLELRPLVLDSFRTDTPLIDVRLGVDFPL